MTLKELLEQRAAHVVKMRAFNDANPSMTPEQIAQWDAMDADEQKMSANIERLKKLEATEAQMAAHNPVPGENILPAANSGSKAEQKAQQEKVDTAWTRYLRFGLERINAEDRGLISQRYVNDGSRPVNPDPRMALTTSTGAGGEYLVPTGFSDKLEEALKWFGGIDQVADVFTTETGNPIPYPMVNDTGQMATLLGVNQPAQEADPSFSNITFYAYKFTSGIVQVPIELIQDSFFDLDMYIAKLFATRFARAYNHYGTVGTGTQQPTGVSTVVPAGITAATGNTTTLTADNLIDLEHSVDIAYRNGAKFMLHDQSIRLLRKLKDNYGQYLYTPGFATGTPATLLGYPYVINNDMPTVGAGMAPVIFGSFEAFKIRKVSGYTVLRLTERYAEYGQVAFIAFARWDSQLLDAGTHPLESFVNSAT